MNREDTEILIARLAQDFNLSPRQAREMSRRAGLDVPELPTTPPQEKQK